MNFYRLSPGKGRPTDLLGRPPIIFYGYQKLIWGRGPGIETFTFGCPGIMNIHIQEGLTGGSYLRTHEWGGGVARLGHYRLALSLCVSTLNNSVESNKTNEARALAVYEQIATGPIANLPESWELDDADVYQFIKSAEQGVI